MEQSYLSSLNPQQRMAVTHGVELDGSIGGPLLIIAGAGSGKTKTLAHRVGHLVAMGFNPERVLLLTFSRRAAAEMITRAQTITATSTKVATHFPWAGTFHSVGAKIIREYADQIGVNPSFTILDREDAADLLDLVRHDLDMHLKNKRFPQKTTCLSIYSRVTNGGLRLDEVLEAAFPWCISWTEDLQRLFAAYVVAKQAHSSLDYDDLLCYWAQMMQLPELAQHVSARFDHILIDEFQDTNGLQSSILLNLRPDGRGMVVVGDDAQAIYSFRSATVRNILDFPNQFSPPATIITLDRNYRSTGPILDASNAVIGQAAERFTKDLWTDRKSKQKPSLIVVRDDIDQAKFVAGKVLEHREAGASLKQQAILFRASHHCSALELELTRRDIPYVKFGGLKFLDAVHVKDVIAVLRLAENPRDRVAAFRVFKLLPGVGSQTAGRIVSFMQDYAAPLQRLNEFRPPAGAADHWRALTELLGHLSAAGHWPSDIEAVRQWYTPYLENGFEDPAPRMADLVQLVDMSNGYLSRMQFLTELSLDPPEKTSGEAADPSHDEDYLTLSTIHSAKGREWKNVFVLNCVDGCIPSDLGVGSSNEIEEERRLLYVAMTRAKDDLHLMIPQKWYVHQQAAYGDRHVYASRTRFITNDMLGYFEQRAWSSYVGGDVAMPSVLPHKMVDLTAKMRERWR